MKKLVVKRDGRGATLVLVAFITAILISLAFGAVDIGAILIARGHARSVAECVKQTVMNDARYIKSTQNPAEVIAEDVGDALAACGLEGTAEVAVYELNSDDLKAVSGGTLDGTSERVLGVSISFPMSYGCPVPIIDALKGGGTVQTSLSWSIVMYAPGQEVWHPTHVENARKVKTVSYGSGGTVIAGAGTALVDSNSAKTAYPKMWTYVCDAVDGLV